MARALYVNNAVTALALNASQYDTQLTVVDGSVFPSPTGGNYAYLTLSGINTTEIVKLTARSGNVLTVTRAQDNTVAQAFPSGSSVSLRVVAALLDDLQGQLVQLETDFQTADGALSAAYIAADAIVFANSELSNAALSTSLTASFQAADNTLQGQITTNTASITTLQSTTATNTGAIATLQTELTAETTARTAADTALQTDINTRATVTELTTVETNLTSAIGTVSTALTAETTARTAADTALQTDINTRATVTELTTVETNLTSAIASSATTLTAAYTAADAAVTSAYQSADSGLQGQITTNANDITAAEANITTLQSATASNTGAISTLQTDLSAEVTNRTNADTALQTDINTRATVTQLTTTESNLTAAIASSATTLTANYTAADAAVTSAYQSADSGLQGQITTNAGNITTAQADITTLQSTTASNTGAISTLTTNLSAEVTNRTNADTALQGQITTNAGNITTNSANITTLQSTTATNTSAISTLTTNLSAEVTNRTNADTALQGQITTNAGNITTNSANITTLQSTTATNTSAISTLTTNLSAEVTNRTNADTALQGQITTNAGNITTNAAAITTEATARASGDAANATSITNLTATFGKTTKQLIVDNFNNDGFYWTAGFGGAPESVADPADFTYTDVATIGRVAQLSTFNRYLQTKAAIKPYVGLKLRLEVKIRATVNPTSGQINVSLFTNGLSSSWAHGGATYSATAVPTYNNEENGLTVADGWITLAVFHTCTGISTYDAGWRPRLDLTHSGSGGTVQIAYFRIEDVTELQEYTDAQITTEASTRAAADSANASLITTLQASFAGRGTLNPNPYFDEGPASVNVVPPRWSGWSNPAGQYGQVVAKPFGAAGLHYYMSGVPAATSMGVRFFGSHGSVIAGQKYLISAEVELVAKTYDSAGIYCPIFTSADVLVSTSILSFRTARDSDGDVSTTKLGRRRFQLIITAPANSSRYEIYAMGRWTGLGSSADAPDIRWYECSISRLDNNTAGITNIAEAYATNDSSKARLVWEVNTSTNVATIEQTAATGFNDGTWNGSAIKLSADLIELLAKDINFGTNTTYEDTYATLYTEKNSKRLRILGPFPASDDIVMWFGPTSVALNSETKTNGHFCFATDGKIYLGNAELANGVTPITVTRTSGDFVSVKFGSGTNNTGSVTFSASGGVGTKTFAHELAVGYTTGPSASLTSATGATTAVTASGSPGDEVRGLVITTATDGDGNATQFTSPLFLSWEV